MRSVEGESQSPSGRLRKAQVRRAGGHRVGRRALRREAVGICEMKLDRDPRRSKSRPSRRSKSDPPVVRRC
jgi:hypothetical protein